MLVEAAQRAIQWRLFKRHESLFNSWQVVAWWEARRIPYNLIVGVSGIVTVTLCLATAALCQQSVGVPIGVPNPPVVAMLAVVFYALGANVCYTAGWVAEIVVAKIWPGESTTFGQISFCLGLVFSLLLTLLPGVLIAVLGAFTLLSHALSS